MAIVRGHGQWGAVPTIIWLHLITIVVALALTPVVLLRTRGDARHRTTGTVWMVAMIATAILSLFIRNRSPTGFSVIHILSAVTLLAVPRAWWTARRHQVRQHRTAIRTIVTGALLIAGFFTFPFERLLGRWLFG